MTSRAQDDPTQHPPVDTDVRGRWWIREQKEREASENGDEEAE